MKTIQQQETEAILALGEAHDTQREVIYRLGQQVAVLERELAMANERVRHLESQIYGGK
jgi:hypothetical protein